MSPRGQSRRNLAPALGLFSLVATLALLYIGERWFVPWLSPSRRLSGRVASKGKPLTEVRVTCDESRDDTNSRGEFELLLSDVPSDESFLKFEHSGYVTRFLRWDDPNLSAKKAVEMEPKRRTIVVDCVGDGGFHVSEDFQLGARRAMKSQLEMCSDLEPLAEGLRNRIVKKLFEYQEGRALYDPDTLIKVREFHGATHGVFVTASADQQKKIKLDAVLVDLESTSVQASSRIRIPDTEHPAIACAALADALLAQLCQVTILSPRPNAKVDLKIPVRGYVTFKPESWELYLSVLPVGVSRHYPQQPITIQEDGLWTAPTVTIGLDDPSHAGRKFQIYPLLVDPEGAMRIKDYHRRIERDAKSDDGIDLDDRHIWPAGSFRILRSISVVRNTAR